MNGQQAVLRKFWTVQRLARLGIFVALSAVGAYIKIPSITGTPALDSFPGYLAATAFGVSEGALVAGLGHLLTALTAGFPLTVFLHLLIALGMAGCAAAVGGLVPRIGLWPAGLAGVILNGVVFPALFIPLPGFGQAFFMAMLVPLVVSSAVNILIALLVYRALQPFGQKLGLTRGT